MYRFKPFSKRKSFFSTFVTREENKNIKISCWLFLDILLPFGNNAKSMKKESHDY